MFHETLAPKNTLDPGEGLEGRGGRVPVIQPFEIPLQHFLSFRLYTCGAVK